MSIFAANETTKKYRNGGWYAFGDYGDDARLGRRPPEILYHGTIEDNKTMIIEKELLPMNRQYVHLSIDEKVANEVAKRKKGKSLMIKILAKKANEAGVKFYQEENNIWLTDWIPSQFIFF